MSRIVEEWRPVVGYEGLYEVSDWGNVRSLDRTFEYYHPSANGVIRRTFKGKVLKKVLNFEGYHIVTLLDANHKQRQGKVHRLVAVAWLPNPEKKKEVGHLKTLENGLEDRTANEVWNLQWMTREENGNYGTIGERLSKRMTDNNPMKRPEVAAKVSEQKRIIGRVLWKEHPEKFDNLMNSDKHNEKKKIKINQYNKSGDFIKTWDSAADVERELRICHSNVASCCRGKTKTAGGFKWRYTNDN